MDGMISDVEITIRLGVAALLGSLIGFERERLLWAAGVRTHMLVSVGSCLLMIVSAYGFQSVVRMEHVVLDPSRIAAQVVSGIGFLGAGSILLRGQVVKGLTTAASVWTVAAIGLAAGGGLYFAASLATIIILGILAGLKPLEDAYRVRALSAVLRIEAERGAVEAEEAGKAAGVRGGQLRRVSIKQVDDGSDEILLYLVKVSERDIGGAVARLGSRPKVRDVRVLRRRQPAD